MSRLQYPVPEKVDVVENYHGTEVADPFRYMEDPEDPRTLEFIEKNNELVEQFISADRVDYYKKKLAQVFQDVSLCLSFSKVGDSYYYQLRNSLDPQPLVYRKRDGEVEQILDINSLSEDGTTAVTSMEVSPDERYLCVSLSVHGSDWQTLSIYDMESKEFVDSVEWVRFTPIEWLEDSSGFYYQRFPDQTKVAEEDKSKFARLYLHRIGRPYTEDTMVFDPGDKTFTASPLLFEGLHLFVLSNNSTMPENRLYYRREGEDKFHAVVPELNGNGYLVIGTKDDRAYILTSENAANRKVVTLDLGTPRREAMRTVIEEGEHPIGEATLTHDRIALVILQDAKHVLRLYTLEGTHVKDVPLPAIGSITEIYGRVDEPELLFSFESFFHPRTTYVYDHTTDRVSEFIPDIPKPKTDNLMVKQIFYESRDGTKVPMFIVHREDLELNRDNPTLLYGYGGFNISLTPSFIPQLIPWLMDGGVYAVPNLRGGGEYGENWHTQGILERKQNVFDDFIAAAEYLISNKYTSPARLAINGRSNGGLLVGAVMVQRPDLFGAAVPQVGVLDMLRYPLFTIGRFWVKEYGDAINNPEHFRFLHAYSPLHNIRPGVEYPATLITAAEGDNRVVPAHSLKFAATLQQTYQGDNPILLRIERKAGHGFGKPLTKIIEDMSYKYAFLSQVLGT